MSVLVARSAPDFTAPAVMADGSIKENFKLSDFKGKYIVLFFWPLDFTFVCPTEIIAHDHRFTAFAERDVQIIGVSIDSQFSHWAWRNTDINDGGIGQVQFPMVADVKHKICEAYGIMHPEKGTALRASFLIDKNGIVQHQIVNNGQLGRNMDEMLRLVDALHYAEEHGEVCPAGWQKGQEGMKASSTGVASYLAEHNQEL